VILYPAVDIRGGRAVRLTQGDYGRETVFDTDPLDAARRWVEAGALGLHVVDLDGARLGEPVNTHHLERIAKAVPVPVQAGGGLRDSVTVEEAIAVGAARVVLGTAALTNPDLVGALVEVHGDRVLVSIDVRDGRVAHSGWLEEGDAGPAELVAAMGERGVRGFVYTAIEADGTLAGPDLDGLKPIGAAVAESDGELLYSGGVGSLEHLEQLADARIPALGGAIVGRALYEGRFTVAEGQAVLNRGGAESTG
jgi:phosphoribosylformimino-5-aminoimidazole carboxamide ribotide isomerase